MYGGEVALHPEGVDRNPAYKDTSVEARRSPSTRRAWIEIVNLNSFFHTFYLSPSTRRAWIEIVEQDYDTKKNPVALHPEGVDRNNVVYKRKEPLFAVALHPEGVDRNLVMKYMLARNLSRRPPPGGRG